MKLKKIAAVAAAAVMSLAMLTACGGGGSSAGGDSIPAGGWTRELITVEEDGEEVAEADASRNYYTSDGKWVYSKSTYKNSVREHLYSNTDDGQDYALNTSGEVWKAYKYTAADDVDDDNGVTTKTEGTGKYKGETYRTVIYTTKYTDGVTIVSTYYYSGASLKYIQSEQTGTDGTYSSVRKVLVDKSGVDKANEKKLDINNYTLVDSYEDLGLAY